MTIKLTIISAFATACWVAAAIAQTPPPPSGSDGERAGAGSAAPGTSSNGAGSGVLNDIEDQDALSALDRRHAAIREQVLAARMGAQRFRLARAKLSEAIKVGKCGSIASVLATIDQQEADTRKLLDNLDSMCSGESAASAVASACSDERRKLDDELSGFAQDRVAVKNMCPTSAH